MTLKHKRKLVNLISMFYTLNLRFLYNGWLCSFLVYKKRLYKKLVLIDSIGGGGGGGGGGSRKVFLTFPPELTCA